MLILNDKTYRAAIYLRLSQEDGDISVSEKNESNSISTQRDLIHAYLQKQPDIEYAVRISTRASRPKWSQSGVPLLFSAY